MRRLSYAFYYMQALTFSSADILTTSSIAFAARDTFSWFNPATLMRPDPGK